MKKICNLFTLAMLCGVALVPSVQAANYWWTGSTAINSLNVAWAATNFTSDVGGTIFPGVVPGAADTIMFNADPATSPFTLANGNGIALQGNRAALGLQFTNGNGWTIQSHATAATSETLSIGAGGILVGPGVSSVVFTNPASRGFTTIALTANQTWNLNGDLTAVALSGAYVLTKSGPSTLFLQTTNPNFSGGFTLSSGTLKLNNAGSLGSGPFTINGGTLDASMAANFVNPFNNIQAWNGDFAFAGTTNFNLGTGAVTLGANLQVTVSANTLTVGGGIAGNYSFSKAGAGALSLSGANTYGGDTIINAGALRPGATGSLGSGTVSVNTGGSLYPIVGVVVTNPVTLNGGTLEVGGGGSHVLTLSSLVTMTADSTMKSDGGTYGIYLNGGLDMGNGGYTFNSINGTSGNFNSISTISGQSGTIIHSGSGSYLGLPTANTFGGTFRVASGQINVNDVNAMQNATLDMNAADSGSVFFAADDVIGALTGSRNLALGGGTISIGNNNASTLYEGVLSGTGSLAKLGSGTLTLDNACTYTGNTTISAGTLALSGGGSIAGSTNIIVAGGAVFDVSAQSPGFVLNGRVLTNSSVGAVLSGANNCSSGMLSLVYDGVNPCFIQTNGAMILSPGTVMAVNNTGAVLSAGSHTIIAAATTGNSGQVTGTLPSVVVAGNGASGAASLQINGSGGLDLVVSVATPPPAVINSATYIGGNLVLQGTNGASSGTYSILTSTNLAVPLADWATNATGTFTAGGTFSNAIPVSGDPERFFNIKQP